MASVVICTNREVAGLCSTLQAVMDQEFPRTGFEVIVVDNAGRDPSAFHEFTSRWPDRLKIVPCLLPGLSAARNTGIGAARSDYICFLDDDAVPAPAWLANMVKALSEHPDAAVAGLPRAAAGVPLHPPRGQPARLQLQ